MQTLTERARDIRHMDGANASSGQSPSVGARPGRNQGVTLVELIVTLAIFSILIGVAAPSFNSLMLAPRLGGHANSLMASATLARSEAIKRNVVVTLCASGNGSSCASTGHWGQGWIVLAGTELITSQPPLPENFLLVDALAGSLQLNFQPAAAGGSQAAIVVCQRTPEPGAQERIVSISATGRASVASTRNGTCA